MGRRIPSSKQPSKPSARYFLLLHRKRGLFPPRIPLFLSLQTQMYPLLFHNNESRLSCLRPNPTGVFSIPPPLVLLRNLDYSLITHVSHRVNISSNGLFLLASQSAPLSQKRANLPLTPDPLLAATSLSSSQPPQSLRSSVTRCLSLSCIWFLVPQAALLSHRGVQPP